MPKVSIVTVSYNAEDVIEKTILSVLNQKFDDYEYIIIDGKSKDNTNKIIKKYIPAFERKNINVTYISEKDNGIYDAMNKGINIAQGEWINFMNCGDTFYQNDTLKNVFDYNISEDIDILYGNQVQYLKDIYIKISAPQNVNGITERMPFCHQSSFVRIALMKEYRFDTRYKILSDYDFFLRCYIENKKFRFINEYIAKFSIEGVSMQNHDAVSKENMLVRKSYGLYKDSAEKNNFINKIKLYIKGKIPLNILYYKYKYINGWSVQKDNTNI